MAALASYGAVFWFGPVEAAALASYGRAELASQEIGDCSTGWRSATGRDGRFQEAADSTAGCVLTSIAG